jgi:uncharacterized protein YndB with AHSA1/START domain
MSCVSREVTLPLEADEAWETVTELEGWLVTDADLTLEPGEEGTLRLPGGEERRAVVERVEPGERLAFWWWTDSGRQQATLVELTLAPAVGGTGTTVVVVESGYAAGPVMVGGDAWGPLSAGAVHRTAVGAMPVGLITPLLRAPVLAERLVDAAERRVAV